MQIQISSHQLKETFDEVQFYTIVSNIDAAVQRQLLEARYPDKFFFFKICPMPFNKPK